MRKLLNMHEWLTLDKSASYLSDMLDESVLIPDLYRLALDNKLTLSIRFLESVPALIGKLVDEDDFFTQTSDDNMDESHCESSNSFIPIDIDTVDFSELVEFTPIDTHDSSEPVDDDTWFIYEDIAQYINDIWDLTMLGLESVDIEQRYLDELGESGYNPKRYREQGVFVRDDTYVCKLLSKVDPSPVYEDKDFVREIIDNFLVTKEIYFDECIDYDFDILASGLTSSERDHIAVIIDYMSVSFPTDKNYKNCLTIEDYSHQMLIKSQELERFIQLF